MKTFRILSTVFAAAITALAVSCANSDDPAGDPILLKTENVLLPPEKAGTIRTAELVYSLTTDKEKDMRIRIRYKAPNRYRLDLLSPQIASVCCIEGPTPKNKEFMRGWRYSQQDGVTELKREDIKKILDKLSVLPFHRNLTKLYRNSDQIGSGVLNQEECWILTCDSKPFKTKQAVCIWISKDSSLIRQIEIGDEKIIQFFDYGDFDGIKLPRRVFESEKEIISRTALISAEWNQEIPESVFQKPEPFNP